MHIHAFLIVHTDHRTSLLPQTYQQVSLWFVTFRLIVRSGNSSLSQPLFDSDLDDVPERGLLSESSTLYLELTADSSSIPLLLALRYEGEHRPIAYQAHGDFVFFSPLDVVFSTFSTTQMYCSSRSACSSHSARKLLDIIHHRTTRSHQPLR